ncbi:MAG: PAS domain-containing protein [Deltaproteobacteria bacterium]|nr:PAS domain-containing protein [Deltaproteobacteria bacterium]
MKGRNKHNRFWTGVPPWLFIGAVVVLFPIFAFMTIQNINRQNQNSARLLMEKGAALIRSFEAGTRTGMGMSWNEFQLQKLLTETAQQSDIRYLLVTDVNGTVLAHDNPGYIGQNHGRGLNLKKISHLKTVQWRIVRTPDGKKIFEVFSKFSPVEGGPGMGPGRMMFHMWFQRGMNEPRDIPFSSPIIFVGLDMTSIEDAVRADTRHAVIMGIILLLVGFAGIVLLFLAQSYRVTKMSLSRIKAFSDNLVTNMPIGLVALDDNQRITSLNNVAGSVLKLLPAEVIGENAEKVLPAELWHLLKNLNVEKGVVEKEIDCTVQKGEVIPLEISATLLNDEDGTFLGYVVLFKDLSEVRSLRKEIARSQRLASVGRLAAGVSHEIRNPLSSIKGFATYFKERYYDVPENQQISNLMIQEVDRLNRVVGQLHEFARPIIVSKKPIQIKAFLKDSLKLIERQASEAFISIKTDFDSEIDEILIDPDRINQVLLNLYLNAIESMDNGGSLTVMLVKNSKKNGIEIKVSDTGTGITEEDLAQIFDPYFTTKASGTGLGLAIVYNIMEAHGGEITIESHLGQGTVVTLFFSYAGTKGAALPMS